MIDSKSMSWSVEENQRQALRRRINIRVRLKSSHGLWAGFTENISEGGVFVATPAPLRIGDEINIDLALGGELGSLPIRCRVQWVRPVSVGGMPAGMGLRFLDLGAEALAQIRAYITRDQPEILFWDPDDVVPKDDRT